MKNTKQCWYRILMVPLLTLFLNPILGQNPIWTLPDRQLNFTSGIQPLPQPGLTNDFLSEYVGQDADFSHNSMVDVNGDLLFFTVDHMIYDKEGFALEQMLFNGNRVKGLEGLHIVPDPADCERYYIFSSTVKPTGAISYDPISWNNFYESVPVVGLLDMSVSNCNLNNTTGEFVAINAPNNTSTPLPPSFKTYHIKDLPDFNFNFAPGKATVPQTTYSSTELLTDNNGDPYRLVFMQLSDYLFVIKIDSDGLTNLNATNNDIITMPGSIDLSSTQITGAQTSYSNRNEMEVISLPNGNLRIASVVISNKGVTGQVPQPKIDAITIFDINPQNLNIISGSEKRIDIASNSQNITRITGLEFSPSGEYLYFTHDVNALNSSPIEVYQINNEIRYPLNFTGVNSFEKSQIEIGADNKLYFATNNRLATFSNPNNPLILDNQGNFVVNSQQWTNNAIPLNNYNLSPGYNDLNNTGYEQEVYLLPRQISDMDYQQFSPGGVKYFTASGTQTWTPSFNPITNPSGQGNVSTVTIHCELRIPAGADITIKDMEFKFGPNGRVVIERGFSGQKGGRLTINNTTFTNFSYCKGDTYWQGVEVLGYASQPQTNYSNSNQGWFNVRNSSVIENARKGATASGGTSNPGLSQGGGVIQGTSSTFRNNKLDVEFFPYDNPGNSNLASNNISFFNECNFITDNLLKNPNDATNQHVLILTNSGVSFNGCNFENQIPQQYNDLNRSTGIYVYNAYTSVKEKCNSFTLPCNSFTPSTFKNLTYGVYVHNPISAYGFDCKNSEFINNQFGIRMNNVNGASVTNNDFEVSRENPSNTPYGLYALACNRYQIEANDFTSFDNAGASASDMTYGAVIDNSINSNLNSCAVFNNATPQNVFFYEEKVYRNSFSQLNVGTQSQDNNVLPPCNQAIGNLSQYGLEFKCNNYFGNIFDADISVNEVQNNIPDEMSSVQGTCGYSNSQAGNSFSYTGGGALDFFVHFNSTTPEYQYRFHGSGGSNLEPLTIFTPNLFDKLPPCNEIYGSNTCQSKIRVPGRLPGSVVISNGISFRDQIDSLSNLMDDGDTQALLDDIDNLSNGQLKDLLLDISPYLSDKVLLTYLQSNPPAGHLKQVILANSPVSSAVMDELDGMMIPKGIKNQINDAQEGFSGRDQLYAEMKAIASEMKTEEFELIDYYLKDTLVENGLDSLVMFLEPKEEFYYRNMLFETHLLRFDTASAQIVKDELDSLLDEGAKKAMKLQLDLSGSAAACFRVKDEQPIKDKANDLIGNQNRKACAKAEGLLAFANDTLKNAYVAPILFNTTSSAMMQDENNDKDQTEKGFKMHNQPNPYANETNILVEISQEIMERAEIVVFDVTGRIINRYTVEKGNNNIVHKAGTSKGVVFYSLIIDGQLKSTEKMLILE